MSKNIFMLLLMMIFVLILIKKIVENLDLLSESYLTNPKPLIPNTYFWILRYNKNHPYKNMDVIGGGKGCMRERKKLSQ
jgi:hypothetical protein